MVFPRRLLLACVSMVVTAGVVVGMSSPALADATPAPSPAVSAAATAVVEAPVEQSQTPDPQVAASATDDAVPPAIDEGGTAALPAPATTPDSPATAAPDQSAVKDFDPTGKQVIAATEFSDTYAGPNGTTISSVSASPINMQSTAAPDATGGWVPIQTDLQTTGPWSWLGQGGAKVDQHPLHPQFSQYADDQNVVQLAKDANTIGFTLQGANHSVLERDLAAWSSTRNHLEYKNVFDNTDLVYDVTTAGVNELFRLNSRPDSSPVWTWRVDAPGLTAVQDPDGGITFSSASGATAFSIPAPTMWDSAGTDQRANAAAAVRLNLLKQGDSYLISVAPDAAWLADPARVYPVSVDPSVGSADNDRELAYRTTDGVSTNLTNTNNHVWIGNSNGNGVWRSVVHYNYEQFFGKQIVGAEIAVTAVSLGYSVDPHSGGVSAATCDGPNCGGAALGTFTVDNSSGGNTDPSGTGIAYRLSDWVRTNTSGNGFSFGGDETPGQYTLKVFDTRLYVAYKDFPAPGTLPSPANGATNQSLTPALGVGGSYDPNGAGLGRWTRLSANPNPEVNPLIDTGWVRDGAIPVSKGLLQPGTTYYWRSWVEDASATYYPTYPVWPATPVYSFTTDSPPRPDKATALPVDHAVVTTTQPVFSIGVPAVPDGLAFQYRFTITTGTDATSGQVIASPWQSGTTWSPPDATALQDGGTYSWSVLIKNSVGTYGPVFVNSFSINKRLGTGGPSPSDAAGPVSVNLANGNVNMSFSSPTVSTVGGAMGMGFTYNSEAPSNAGLNAEYFNGMTASPTNPTADFAGATKVLSRVDPQINFNWGDGTGGTPGSPAPGLVDTDHFLARWTGFIQSPDVAATPYQFGYARDDGAQVFVGGATVIDQWNAAAEVSWGSATALSSTPSAITVNYFENTGGAAMVLLVRKQGDTGPGMVVPTSWFTRTVATLPTGWSASTAIAGPAGFYSKAQVNDTSVVLTDASGAVHTYVSKPGGSYTPPAGEAGILTVDGSKQVSLTDEAGTVYLFNSAGVVSQVSSPQEALKPAAPVVQFRAGTGTGAGAGAIDTISDRLSAATTGSTTTYSRQVKFVYTDETPAQAGLSGTDLVGGKVCKTDPLSFTGTAALTVGPLLCRIVYPGHVQGVQDYTEIEYNAYGQLVRITNPGNAQSTFAYDAQGRVTVIRNVLQNDWLTALPAATPARSATATNATTISYDTRGRATKVALPAPDGVTASAQPTKLYTYGDTLSPAVVNTTYVDSVDSAGTPLPNTRVGPGHAETVTYDSALRTLTSTSAMGLTASTVWNDKDQTLSAVNAQGLEATTLYDTRNRATDSYGPAAPGCFNPDRTATPACASTTAHTHTGYDENLQALNSTYYDNPSWTGVPKAYSLGIPGTATAGDVNMDWNTSSPMPGIPAASWSARMTGTITFPDAGTYTLQTDADDGTVLWVDNTLLFNDNISSGVHWSPLGMVTIKDPGTVLPVRLDYANQAGPGAYLALTWIMPGKASFDVIPHRYLSPDYGLATSSKTDDAVPAGTTGVSTTAVTSLTTSTTYGSSPWLGMAATNTIDPGAGKLNLTTTTTYETTAAGYQRRIGKTLPAATATGAAFAGSTYSYYSNTSGYETSYKPALTTPVCGVPLGTPQYGMLQTSSTPSPTTAGGGTIAASVVYDSYGRIAGSRASADSDWQCITYDSRNRATKTVYPAYGGQPARTVTVSFTDTGAATGNPLKGSATDDSIASTTTGGKISTTTDLLGRTVTYTDVWNTVTTPTYNAIGQVISTSTLANGSTSPSVQAATYDPDGKVTQITANGAVIAVPAYGDKTAGINAGQLIGVSYPAGAGAAGNGSALALTRNSVGASSSMAWTFVAGQPGLTDTVARSESGRILTDTTLDGTAAAQTSTYGYDAAGRLTTAQTAGHSLVYGFAASGGCGVNAAAGMDGNRT
ncbi:PA14 domain-containing protein, partial [Subtercola vilae]